MLSFYFVRIQFQSSSWMISRHSAQHFEKQLKKLLNS